jgi:hypothetical protein
MERIIQRIVVHSNILQICILTNENKSIAPLPVFHECRKRRLKDWLRPYLAETNCDGLTCYVCSISHSKMTYILVKYGCLGGLSLLGIKREWYVCKYLINGVFLSNNNAYVICFLMLSVVFPIMRQSIRHALLWQSKVWYLQRVRVTLRHQRFNPLYLRSLPSRVTWEYA